MKNADMYFDFAHKDDRACLKEMVHGYNISCAIFAVVQLKIADYLSEGPLNPETLAQRAGVNLDALKRVMCLLTNAGVFRTDSSGNYGLAPRGEYLTRSHPQSIASEVQLFAGEETYLAWSRLGHSLKTGEAAFKNFFGTTLFEYLPTKPASAERFHSGWKEISSQVGLELADTYDFSASREIIDVGGGYGVVVAPVIKKFTSLRGAIYDLEFSLEGATDTIQKFGIENRCKLIVGDAMHSVPPGADIHLFKSVLHNCPDKDAICMLNNSAASLEKDGRVLVLERVVSPTGAYLWGNVVDVAMLVMTGGRERTLEHYGQLYRKAGFELTREIVLPSGFSVIEGRKR